MPTNALVILPATCRCTKCGCGVFHVVKHDTGNCKQCRTTMAFPKGVKWLPYPTET